MKQCSSQKNKFAIKLKINGKRIPVTHLVRNDQTGECIGYNDKGEHVISCRVYPGKYDFSITTNISIPTDIYKVEGEDQDEDC